VAKPKALTEEGAVVDGAEVVAKKPSRAKKAKPRRGRRGSGRGKPAATIVKPKPVEITGGAAGHRRKPPEITRSPRGRAPAPPLPAESVRPAAAAAGPAAPRSPSRRSCRSDARAPEQPPTPLRRRASRRTVRASAGDSGAARPGVVPAPPAPAARPVAPAAACRPRRRGHGRDSGRARHDAGRRGASARPGSPSRAHPRARVGHGVRAGEKMRRKSGEIIKGCSSWASCAWSTTARSTEAKLVRDKFGFDVEIRSVEVMFSRRRMPNRHAGAPAPVVTVMGHVDMARRRCSTASESRRCEKEFGGITQHIGAYQVMTSHGKVSSWTRRVTRRSGMRARGAQATTSSSRRAADDGVMRMTQEPRDRRVPGT